MAMWVACFKMGLTPLDIIRGTTINAAHAINREKTVGSIEVGKKADLLIFDAPNIDFIFYRFARNLISQVWKDGHLVVEDGRVIY